MELPAILLKELLQFVLVEKFVHQTNVERLLTLVEALVDDSFDFNLAPFWPRQPPGCIRRKYPGRWPRASPCGPR